MYMFAAWLVCVAASMCIYASNRACVCIRDANAKLAKCVELFLFAFLGKEAKRFVDPVDAPTLPLL